MSDEAREYIRAAQQAELSGDKPRAVDLLEKAAAVYRQRGQNARALQMLRYASKLAPARTDIAEQVRRLEWLPERPMLRAVTAEESEAEDEAALASLDALSEAVPQPPKQLIERGPSRADPALNAWCSFCCRPRTEVGDLVAGPAGAFVCLGCVKESARILEWEPAAKVPERIAAPPPVGRAMGPVVDPVGQGRAVERLQAALRLNVGAILLVGPEGSGKSTHLIALERRGLGVYAASPSRLQELPSDVPALIDHLDEATPEDWAALARAVRGERSAPVVLSVRGQLPEAEVVLTRDGAELPLHSTTTLHAATGGRVPPEVLERIGVAIGFGAPTREELVEVARQLAVLRGSEVELSDELLAVLAELALSSGRLGHELRALLGRIPAGGWSGKRAVRAAPSAPAPKKAARKKRKPEEG